MARTYTDAVEAVTEYIIAEQPDNEAEALDQAQTALHEFVDSALIYTVDVLELWDGTTNENVTLSDYECITDIMDAIVASTYFQLCEDWSDAVYDGIDAAILEYLTDWDSDEMSRDDALAYVFGTRD